MNQNIEQNPLQFTEAAIKHLLGNIAKKPDAVAFRLSLKKSGCSGYMYVPEFVSEDKVRADDIHFTAGELEVYVDVEFLDLLTDTLVDMEDKNLGRQIVFRNPRAADVCGCGESFSIDSDKA